MDSILLSVKKLLGIDAEYAEFDTDIIIHINSVFDILNQLGVGPAEGFSISDSSTVWTDYISDNLKLSKVKSYMFMKVKLLFDPPTNSSLLQSYKDLINEFEWRLNVTVDPAES